MFDHLIRLTFKITISLAVILSTAQLSFAQDDPLPIIEWQKRQTADERLTAYGNDLLGDSIDRHLGSLTFEHTDISLPGNSNLEVAIRRRLSQGENYREDVAVEFADWELVVPKISAVVTDNHGWAGQRCSGSWFENFPWIYSQGQSFQSKDYTNGVKMDIPGQGSQTMLKSVHSSNRPGEAYTVQEWYFTCTAATDGGQGFIAHAPNGDKYYFKKFLSRAYNRLGFAKKSTVTIRRNKVILAATEVRDVHGNWVKYDYVGDRLKKIHSNDGREITLSHSGDLISSVSANGRIWDYAYRDTNYQKPEWHVGYYTGVNRKVLSQVTRPDNLEWVFNTDAMQAEPSPASRMCTRHSHVVEMTHPNGTTGQFAIIDIEHRQGYKTITPVAYDCYVNSTPQGDFENGGPSGNGTTPDPHQLHTTRTFSVASKILSSASIPTKIWSFSYERENPCTGVSAELCANYNPYQTYPHGYSFPYTPQSPAYHYWQDNAPIYKSDDAYPGYDSLDFTNWTAVTQPDGSSIVHYHHWAREELFGGKEVKRIVKDQNGTVLETTNLVYSQHGCNGANPFFASANRKSEQCPTHVTKTVQSRDGDTFTSETMYNMDNTSATYSYGQPISQRSWSSLYGPVAARGTDTVYEHNISKWILGLPSTISEVGSSGSVRQRSAYVYDGFGNRISLSRYNQSNFLTFTYNADGTMASYTDALGRRVEADNWYRGSPQTILQAVGSSDQITISSVIDDNGWLKSKTDAMGRTTSYSHDVMGRLTKINPPGEFFVDTDISYNFPSSGGAVQTITKGQSKSTITYDSMFRTTLEHTQALDTGWYAYVNTSYDGLGRVTFKSQPSINPSETKGVETTYDGLGRTYNITETVAPYAQTKHRYGGSHTHSIYDPEGTRTIYYYEGYDGPGGTTPRHIYKQKNGVNLQQTVLHRNIYGQLTHLQQLGTHDGTYANHFQYFYYDNNQRLCRHYVPEHGATKYQYDAAGQMVAYAKGQADAGCGAVPSSTDRVSQSYDNLGRPTLTDFQDPNTPDIRKYYYDDGTVYKSRRLNPTGGIQSDWTYYYNDLGQLTHEYLDIDGKNFDSFYYYNGSGHLAHKYLPGGRHLVYTPDGLGRTQSIVNGSNTLASNVSYHASGSVHQMTYGNGHYFSQVLNDRLLPESLLSYDGPIKAIDQTLGYDANGRVTSILDGAVSGNNRTYSYDGLGYLDTASGPWGAGSYTYDSLGNLHSKQLGSRTVHLNYDSSNRVSQSVDTGSSGTRTIAYDARGNVTTLGNLAFAYDVSDQPIAVTGTANGIGSANGTYQYDGNLKRVKSIINDGSGPKVIYNIYEASGALVHIEKTSDGESTDYITGPAGTLARITTKFNVETMSNVETITYLHPDHLGSAQAGTDSSGDIAWREQYTPFGEELQSPAANDNLAGFTGHIKDKATGLNYMQARYYDPVIGRFLSVDPVGFLETGSPSQFNRYSYVSNNPINLIDPTGMVEREVERKYTETGSRIQKTASITVEAGNLSQGETESLLSGVSDSFFSQNDGANFAGNATDVNFVDSKGNFKSSGADYDRTESARDKVNIAHQIGVSIRGNARGESERRVGYLDSSVYQGRHIYGHAKGNGYFMTSAALSGGIRQMLSTSIHERLHFQFGHTRWDKRMRENTHQDVYRETSRLLKPYGMNVLETW